MSQSHATVELGHRTLTLLCQDFFRNVSGTRCSDGKIVPLQLVADFHSLYHSTPFDSTDLSHCFNTTCDDETRQRRKLTYHSLCGVSSNRTAALRRATLLHQQPQLALDGLSQSSCQVLGGTSHKPLSVAMLHGSGHMPIPSSHLYNHKLSFLRCERLSEGPLPSITPRTSKMRV